MLGDGEVVDVGGGRTLTAIDSPATQLHLAVHDSQSGILFAGDAVGVRLPDAGVLRPASPPPDFDLDLALASLRKFAARHPTGVALAHYGLVPDPRFPRRGRGLLRRWAEVAEAAWRQGEDIATALDHAFGHELVGVAEEHRHKLETLNGIHSNAAGFRRWIGPPPRCRPGAHARSRHDDPEAHHHPH